MKPKTITVFAQLCNMLPREPLIRISQDQTPSEDGRRFNAQKFNTWDLLCALIFCHLGRCTSLRCIEDGLFTSQQELHHARQAQFLRRSTLSYINNHTNFSILETYYYRVLEHFREALALKFSKTYTKPVFSLDSTTITLCYSLFPRARYRSHKGGFKLHTALNHELLLPEVIDMTAGSVNDVKQAKAVIRQLPPDSIVVMDRGYNDYELFSWLSDRGTTFVTRLKDNALTTPLNNRCLASVPGEWSLHSFEFCGIAARCCEGKSFRLVCWNDTENLRWFRFISNAENLTGPQIAQLYRDRWKIELFFKKLKQNLRVRYLSRYFKKFNEESWSRDYEFGLSNCIAARLFLEDSLGKGNELKQELIFKAYHLENRDYTLQELGKFFAFKSNLSRSAGPLEPKGLTLESMLSESEKKDLNKIVSLLDSIDSVTLLSKDAFLADYRIERNLVAAQNSFGDKRLAALKNAFSLGHVESALPIAKSYFKRGRYVEAVEWLVCSLKVKQCEGEAAYLIADILDKYDQNKAQPFYVLSAESGWAKACFKLAQLSINRGDNQEGFRWYAKAANNKDPEALYRVGNFYFYGLANIEKNVRHAFELYSKAAEKGVKAAAYCVGRMYLHGIAVKQSNVLAEKYFRQTAGHPGADCALAMMYANTPGQEGWVRQKLLSAGLKGNAQALNQLGKLLKTKLFVACSESNYLLINAALMGCCNAINNLFLLWHEGTFVSYIPFDVEANLKVAMEKGDADSMVSYAQFCLKPGARLAYFTQAAKKNSLEAIYQLGEMYACGEEVQQSDEKAAILFSGVAKRGHATATYRLAQCYERGAGVPQSRAIAQQL